MNLNGHLENQSFHYMGFQTDCDILLQDLDLFEREARVLKSLKHPNIAEYIDFFQVCLPCF